MKISAFVKHIQTY